MNATIRTTINGGANNTEQERADSYAFQLIQSMSRGDVGELGVAVAQKITDED